MNFVCIVFELGDKMLTLSSMENLIVQCNRIGSSHKHSEQSTNTCKIEIEPNGDNFAIENCFKRF